MHKRSFRNILLVVLVASLLFSAGPPAPVQASTALYVPGQIIVRLAPVLGVTIGLINALFGTITLGVLPGLSDVYLLGVPLGISAPDLVNLLKVHPGILWVELNYETTFPEESSTDRIYAFNGPDPVPYNGQEAAAALQLEQVHAISRGAGVQVAVIDTGVQRDHPALAGSLHPSGYDFVDLDFAPDEVADGQDNDGDGRVDEGYGHGTHVAGILHLVAPEAQILPVRVLDSEGRGNHFRTASAILYAAQQGADVINLSLGSPQSSLVFREAVRSATRRGAVVVSAAGNLGGDIRQYPAAESCAVAVTALDGQDRRSAFASYGSWVNLSAPGEDIYSSFPVDGYAWWGGTSMAAPFAAGQAALLLGVNSGLSPHQVGALMGGTAGSLAAQNPQEYTLLGAGKVDLLASLQALASGQIPAGGGVLANCSP